MRKSVLSLFIPWTLILVACHSKSAKVAVAGAIQRRVSGLCQGMY
jgi:hypothetical protein